MAAEDVAQDGAQAAAELRDELLDLRRSAHEAGHRGAFEADRLPDALLEPVAGLPFGADRREPLGEPVVAGAAGVGEQGAAAQQPVGQRLDRAAALAPELEASQRPRELAGPRRAA